MQLLELVHRLFLRLVPQAPGEPRAISKRVKVHILKAVFERADRKWQVLWDGNKVSSSIRDQSFFDRLENREGNATLATVIGPHTYVRVLREVVERGMCMRAFSITSDGKLALTASETSSKNDFDYLVGNWSIRNRTLKEPLAGSDEWEEFDATQEFRLVLLGLGNFDIFHTEFDGKPFEGLTVRLFDPQTRLWTIYWADSNAVKLDSGKVGSFDGDLGEFFGREVVAGKDVIVKFHWDKRNGKAPIYSRAFSVDAGRTWEWNWYANFSRP